MSKPVQAARLEHIELEKLRIRVGRLFAALQEAAAEIGSSRPGELMPPIDVCETKEAIRVQVELPGVSAASIDVVLTNSHLRISGKKRNGAPRGRAAHLCSERSYGNFSRIVPLQRWTVDVHGAVARLRQGVLTVWLPKLKDRRGAEFRVEIRDEDDLKTHGAASRKDAPSEIRE